MCMSNVINVKGDVAEMFVVSKKHGTFKVIIDAEDVEKVKQHHWIISKNSSCEKFYVRDSSLKLRLHRYLMNCPKGMVVDHVEANTLDNRKCKLRICTELENTQNRTMYKNNKTGHKWICYDKKKSRYILRIKKKHIGSYKTLMEAVKAKFEELNNFTKINTKIA